MPVYSPTKDDIIRSLEVQLRLKDEHVAHLNETIHKLREMVADRERLLHLQAESVDRSSADCERLEFILAVLNRGGTKGLLRDVQWGYPGITREDIDAAMRRQTA